MEMMRARRRPFTELRNSPLKERMSQAFAISGDRPLTTTQLVQSWYQISRILSGPRAWHHEAVKRAAPVLADRVGRAARKHRRGECPNSSVEQYKFGFERSWRGVALAKKHDEAIAGQKQRYNQWNLTVTIIGAAAAIIAAAARSGPSLDKQSYSASRARTRPT